MRRIISLLLMTLFLTVSAASQNGKLSSAQRELVETEKAFARYCVENGIRAAWLEFFADDGIIFQPGPVNSKEVYSKRPPQTKPLRATLNWEPRYGDVSGAGDLGYNIGPWNYVDNTPAKEPDAHGYFLSIWRRQPDGKWKVALDFGTGGGVAPNADHVLGKPYQPARQYKVKVPSGSNPAADFLRLTEMEKEFSKNTQSVGALESYLALFSGDVRVMRAGSPPRGKELARAIIPVGKDVSLTFTTLGGEVAKSSDLGYTYGSYKLQEGGQTKETGYYAHIWKRDERGNWRIVVTNVEKVEKKRN